MTWADNATHTKLASDETGAKSDSGKFAKVHLNAVSELPAIHSVVESGGLSDIFVLRSAEFLGESDEKPFRPADVAEPIRVLILDYFAHELRATLAELFKRLVDVVHGKHDSEVA